MINVILKFELIYIYIYIYIYISLKNLYVLFSEKDITFSHEQLNVKLGD
jgi:hypothetical protein